MEQMFGKWLLVGNTEIFQGRQANNSAHFLESPDDPDTFEAPSSEN